MSIQRLPVFLSAAEHLNFTKAAEEHCISQTAVSQQIKLLEQELGFQLFVREKRGVRLTQAGETFYHQCKQMMTQYQSAVTQSQRIAQGNPNGLRIGYASAYELWTVSTLIQKYRKHYPDRQMEFQSGKNMDIIENISHGKIDLAVISRAGVALPEWMGAKSVAVDPCVLMISSQHPLAKKEEIDLKDPETMEMLKAMPILFNTGQNHQSSMDQISGMYAQLGLSNNKRLYGDEFYSLALLVSLGLAMIMVPKGLENMGMPGLSFIPIKGFKAFAKTIIIYPRHAATPAVRQMLALL